LPSRCKTGSITKPIHAPSREEKWGETKEANGEKEKGGGEEEGWEDTTGDKRKV